MKTKIDEHVRKDGLRQRWYTDKSVAVRVLSKIPRHARGDSTLVEPLQTSSHDGGIWRVDDYQSKWYFQ